MMRVKHVPLLPSDDDNLPPTDDEAFNQSFDTGDFNEDTTLEVVSQASSKESSVLLVLNTQQQMHLQQPMKKFLPVTERSFTEQMSSLSPKERSCVLMLRQQWEVDNQPIPGVVLLRFARFNNFNVKACRKGLNSFDKRYLNLTIAKLGPMLQSKTLFPVPGLKSKDGLDMFYMRPSRYFPKRIQTKHVIDNLAYVMSVLVEKEESSKNGIGFLACMDDWTMENFSVDYCLQFMKMLQGGVPARVGLFLIVNPPGWFDAIWKIMRPMLAPKFRRKVKMVPESMLPSFLASGYQNFLPDDMKTGKASTRQMIKDFVAYRKIVEPGNSRGRGATINGQVSKEIKHIHRVNT